VLAGGGARGAYEAGALSVLLPALEARGERPGVLLGTSIGSVNTAFLAANAHLEATETIGELRERWLAVRWRQLLGPLVSPAELGRLLSYFGELLGVPGAEVHSLLDTSPQEQTMSDLIDFDQAAANVSAGELAAAAVVATSYSYGDSVVFHDRTGDPPPIPRDRRRGIRYAETRLALEHVRASSAIEAAFPAIRISEPAALEGWYGDGGTRLNTPIKPALALGTRRVVVIGLNSLGMPPEAVEDRPDVFDGIAEVLQAVLADPLAHDVQTLATLNRAVGEAAEAGAGEGSEAPAHPKKYRRIPYIFVAPADRLAVGRVALEVWRTHASKLLNRFRERDVALLGTIVDAGRNPVRGELLSYLFFTREFHEALFELGRADAERWMADTHDDGPWRYGPPPTT
jgi:NTE family protein